jgi:hypothetical protein
MAVSRWAAEQGQTVQLGIKFHDPNGNLYDPYEIRQVEIMREDLSIQKTFVTSEVHRLSTGRYYIEWVIPGSETVGKHYDKWYYTPEAGHDEVTAQLEFYVYASGTFTTDDYYLSVSDAKANCLDADTGLTDPQIQYLITLAMAIIDRCCEQHFLPVTGSRVFDGTGSYYLDMDEPIQSVTNIENLDSASYSYTVSDFRIKGTWLIHKDYVEGAELPAHLACGVTDTSLFPKGHQNIRVTGTWGLYETVPDLITQATCLLLYFGGQWDTVTGPMISPNMNESVEGYAYTLRKVYEHAGIHKETGYPEVDTILAQFRRMQFGSKVL